MNATHKNKYLRSIFSLMLSLLLPALVLFFLVRAVRAARRAAPVTTYEVTVATDDDDGACDAHCTLREAIDAANGAAGADSIIFSLPDESTITLNGSRLPAVGEALAIDGGTAVSLTVSGNGASGILEISSGAAVTVASLTLSGGAATAGSSCPGNCGGALFNDGGTMLLEDSRLTDNVAGVGGAIYNLNGDLTLNDVTFEDNSAGNGGAVYNAEGTMHATGGSLSGNSATDFGGGLYNDNGVLHVDDVVFSGHDANDSGAIINVLGTATISNSTFFNNDGTFGGGAVGNYDGQVTVTGSRLMLNQALDGGAISNSGHLAVYSSTLSFNEASFRGGALANSGVLTVSNSTLMTNTVPDGSGGAISGLGSSTITVQNSTFSANEASGNGGGISNASGPLTVLHSTFWGNAAGGSGGGLHNQNGDLSLRNSIFAGSPSGGDCSNAGNMVTNLHNLIEDGSCAQDAIGPVASDPQLGPLQDNGGPTLTHALGSSSPALDAGNNLACTNLSVDQRGALRAVDGDRDGTAVCDIGAFELDVPDAVSDDGPDFRTDEDTPFTTGSVLANDSDPLPGDPLTVADFDPGDSLGTIVYNGDGTFDYDPTGEFDFLRGNQESLTFLTYTVVDSFGLTDTASIFIVVTGRNDAPRLQDVAAEAPAESEDPVVLSGATVDVDQNQPVTLTVDWGDGTVQQFDQGSGTVAFSHSHTYATEGVQTITVTARDAVGAVDQVRLRVVVGEVRLYLPVVVRMGN